MTTAEDKRLNGAQIFALCFAVCMLGLFVAPTDGITPGFLWTTAAVLAVEAVSLLLLGGAFRRTGAPGGYELLTTVFGSTAARIFLLLPGCLFAIRAAFGLYSAGRGIKLYLLEETPTIFPAAVILLAAFLAVRTGLRGLSGLSTLAVLIVPPILLILLVAGFMRADFGEWRILTQPTVAELKASLLPSVLTASGGGAALFFLGSGRTKNGAYKGAPGACAAVFIVCALMLLMSVGTIGSSGVKASAFPYVEAARQINLGGIALTERFDMPLLFCTLIAAIIQTALLIYCAASAFCCTFNYERRGRAALVLLPVILAAACLLTDESAAVIACVNAIGFTVVIVMIFPITALAALFRSRKGGAEAER